MAYRYLPQLFSPALRAPSPPSGVRKFKECLVLNSDADPDPVPVCPLDPGWVKSKHPDPG